MWWGVILFLSLVYNGYIFWRFKKVPESLSETSYLLGGNKRYLFSLYCLITGIILLLELLNRSVDGYEFLPFLLCTGICFAGISPLFRDGIEKIVHYVSSFAAFTAFIVYMILFLDWKWIAVYCTALTLLCLWKKDSYTYFAEILALIVLTISLI